MRGLTRLLRHLFSGRWRVGRDFPRSTLQAIEAAIRQSEATHMGELRFAVEAALEWPQLMRGVTARQRAVEVFSQLRVWDTEHNTGVLIYLLLADRRIEIVADRGIHRHVGDAGWQAICRAMEQRFRAGEFGPGVLQGLEAITVRLQQHFPAQAVNANELPDTPVVL